MSHKHNLKIQIRNYNVGKQAQTLVWLATPECSNLSQSGLELIISSVYMWDVLPVYWTDTKLVEHEAINNSEQATWKRNHKLSEAHATQVHVHHTPHCLRCGYAPLSRHELCAHSVRRYELSLPRNDSDWLLTSICSPRYYLDIQDQGVCLIFKIISTI